MTAQLCKGKTVMMMMWYWQEMGAWIYVLLAAGMILFIIVAVVGVDLMWHFFGPQSDRLLDSPPKTPAERYARGEIDQEEYRRLINDPRPPSEGRRR